MNGKLYPLSLHERCFYSLAGPVAKGTKIVVAYDRKADKDHAESVAMGVSGCGYSASLLRKRAGLKLSYAAPAKRYRVCDCCGGNGLCECDCPKCGGECHECDGRGKWLVGAFEEVKHGE